MKKLAGYLRLMRPANLVTSVADVLAGVAISGIFSNGQMQDAALAGVGLLSASTIGLYGGGVVFNDVFDAALDRIERPERPIPSGLISVQEGALLGSLLLVLGILCAFSWSMLSGILATSIALASLIYDKYGKHSFLLGPLNMGLCRGLNLLLGVSIVPLAVQEVWYLAIIPIIYIASITMISRGEVKGGTKTSLYFASLLYLLVIACVFYFSYEEKKILLTLAFLLPFAFMIYKPLFRAIDEPEGKNIGKAVKAGVIALIMLNASWAAAFGEWHFAVLIVLLLPVSLLLARLFAVT